MPKELEHKTDEQNIWLCFQAGDKAAYACLYHTYYKKLYNYGLRVVADKILAEDCIQDLFIRLWKQKQSLSLPSSVQAYLFQALRRIIYRAIEKGKKSRHSALDESYHYTNESSYEACLVNSQLHDEQRQTLEKAIQSLSPRQREVIYLKFYSDLSYEEIAKIMGLTIESVYNLVSRSIDVLQEKLRGAMPSMALTGYH